MDASELKVRENRLRRAAARQKLFLSKRRRLDAQALDHDRYALLSADKTRAIHGVDAEGFYTLTLEQVERLLGSGQVEQILGTDVTVMTPPATSPPAEPVPAPEPRPRRRLRLTR